jgi:hypothetical protein
MDYKIQSVLIDKNKNTIEEALQFLMYHQMKYEKIDVTDEYIRARQLNPDYLKRKGYTMFRTIPIDENKNIKFIIAYKPSPIQQKEEVKMGGLIIKRSKYI